MRNRTITVDTEVSVDIELDEIPIEDLREELNRREQCPPGGGPQNVLRRIVWEHYVLGLPLDGVVETILHEYGIYRCASAAVVEE